MVVGREGDENVGVMAVQQRDRVAEARKSKVKDIIIFIIIAIFSTINSSINGNDVL